ncbi:Chitin synthase 6, partial [Neolecta irregularis DAH-3]
ASASLAAPLVQLHLDVHGQLSGLALHANLLALPLRAPGCRSFHVFYYLLAGATPQERQFLVLLPPHEYAYLAQSGAYANPDPAKDDAANADDLRAALKSIGIKGKKLQSIYQILSGILLLGNVKIANGFLQNEAVLEEVASLFEIEPDRFAKFLHNEHVRDALALTIYASLWGWIVNLVNLKLKPVEETQAVVSVLEVPAANGSFWKAYAGERIQNEVFKHVFTNSCGLNKEMIDDGLDIGGDIKISSECIDLLEEIKATLGQGVYSGNPLYKDTAAGFEVTHACGQQKYLRSEFIESPTLLPEIVVQADEGSLFRDLPTPKLRSTMADESIQVVMDIIESARMWNVVCLDRGNSWDAAYVGQQVRSWYLCEWITRKRFADYTCEFPHAEFQDQYAPLLQGNLMESYLSYRGLSRGDVSVGRERVWMNESSWTLLEEELDYIVGDFAASTSNATQSLRRPETLGTDSRSAYLGAAMPTRNASREGLLRNMADYDKTPAMYDDKDVEQGKSGNVVQELRTSFSRRFWVFITWSCTWWIPAFVLTHIGRMKRPDVRMAWREKVTLCILIFLLDAFIIFYIVFFGPLLCPEWDKVWNAKEVGYHQGDNDFWVSVRGQVYDISKFWRLQHSDTNAETTASNMQQFAGLDLTPYFPVPLTVGCPGLVKDSSILLQFNDTIIDSSAVHNSGPLQQPVQASALHDINWYPNTFLPKMKTFQKGDLVVAKNEIESQGLDNNKYWATIDNHLYDLSDYFYTQQMFAGAASYSFLDSSVESLFKNNPGGDITAAWNNPSTMNETARTNNFNCIKNVFSAGRVDFRKSARCQANNYILLGFTILLCSVILSKFLAALQFGSKKRPAMQDKFVICQIPAYTEGEDQLRKSIDSLTSLKYHDQRKLLFIVCDGMITGRGNDRPTPRIVLDILGVDPKIEPPALPFKSVAEGSKQLNYGKVYSGLYEYEGRVIPFLVVVKVGANEKFKPGNRGKRDSQVIVFNFLNRLLHKSPMTPLELEVYHQINNVIGVNPDFYEFLLTVDADTEVTEDSLNQLVAACANDKSIIGICGETSLQNEDNSWWTMIQVYEYYISHHLAKAFESLFGSVTCLPGCFSMYRIKNDRGHPIICSSRIIEEYADNHVDTLHKKNLLSLGEDRFLTTLMMKHFPTMKMKFAPDAYAKTAAPETWGVLLSQRRRWINSTIHNLMELCTLQELCSICCFSMRFVVLIDLFGTLTLPATVVYLGYLIYRVSSGGGSFPLISVIMLAAVYGLQAIIFLLRRQWQHIGWMIIYLLAYPVYSFALPVYSFWKMDDFSWGDTRRTIDEKAGKKLVVQEEGDFDDSMIPMKTWDEYNHELLNEDIRAESVASGQAGTHSRMSSHAESEIGSPSWYGGASLKRYMG